MLSGLQIESRWPNMSALPLDPNHDDYKTVRPLVDGVLAAGGGLERIANDLPDLFRTAIDEVIDAPRTNRFTLRVTEKTEKTYLGTKVEILIRNYLGFPKGTKLDLNINGVECDIKNTMQHNWSIPKENVGRPAMLIRLNEQTALCDVGIAILRDEYLNPGKNQDGKRGVNSKRFNDIWWLLKEHRYPANFWEVLPVETREQIMAAGKGTARVAKLFDLIRDKPISRTQVEAIAQQKDPMRRVRKSGGARDSLAPQGIAILSGRQHGELIERLGLGKVYTDEFISYAPTTPDHIAMLRKAELLD